MRHLGLLLAAALCAAGAARADTPGIDKPGAVLPAPPPPKIPQSVWRVGAGRQPVEHLQSGLACEREVYAYRLNDMHIYDGFGLDVSCSYRNDDKRLTVYLNRAPENFDFAANYASAKDAILNGSRQQNPVLLGEDKLVDGPLTWSRATYAQDGGLRSALWLAMLAPGWILEYRATYPAEAEPTVNAALARIGRMVVDSAGKRLKLCTAKARPKRRGALITDPKTLGELSVTTGLLGTGADAAAKAKDAESIVWCPEAPVTQGNISLLFWKGVMPDGSDAMVDRLTAMTMGPPPELQIGLDNLTKPVTPEASKGPAPERWAAMTREGAQIWIWGYFDGRPSPETASAFFVDMLRGATTSIGGYRTDTR